MIIEAITVKVLLSIKGALAIAAHQGLSMTVAQQFANVVGTAGLVAALHWLIGALSATGMTVGFIEALQRLADAIEQRKPLPALEAAADVMAKAFSKN